jgi:hypothetical protein
VADDEQPDLSAFGATSDADSGAAGSDGPDERGTAGVGGEAGESDVAVTPDPDAGDRPSLADLDRGERVELGVDLLAHLEHESLSLSEAVDRIETITTNPALTREILDTADLRGVIDREEGRILTRRGGTFVRFEAQVVRREGDYECRRCGAGLGTGHFVRFEAGELGPFGPECVRKVLGRT